MSPQTHRPIGIHRPGENVLDPFGGSGSTLPTPP